MKKAFKALAIAVCALALVSCPNPTDGGGGGTEGGEEKTPSSGTYIRFVNNGDWPATVYFNSQRDPSSLLATVDASGVSPDIPFASYSNAVFYFSYVVAVNDVEIPLAPNRTVESRIDENFITTITIPSLDRIYTNPGEILVSDVYLSIQNAGGTGFRLQRNNASLLPEGRAGDMYVVNDGETAVWKFPASAVEPQLLSGGATTPLPISQFEAGRLYSLVFIGSLAEFLSDTPITLNNLLPQGTPGFSAPTGLTGEWMDGESAIRLSWNPAPGGACYQVYRSSDALGLYSPITDKTLTGTTFTDSNASVETATYYKVRAYSTDGRRTSPLSGAVMVGPLPPELPPPSGLVAVLDSSLTALLTWNEMNGATSYKVYKGSNSDTVNEYVTETALASYTVTSLEENTSYYFAVSAVYENGESLPSTAAQVKTFLASPQGLSVTGQTENSISLSWQAVSGATGYKVYKGASSDAVNEYVAETALASYTVTDLVAGTDYYFAVCTIHESEEGLPSIAVQGETSEMMAPVPVLIGEDRSITVSWASVSSADSYNVYYNTDPILPETPNRTGVTGTSTVITGLINDTTYYVWVEAVNPGGTKMSEAVPGIPQQPSVQDHTVSSAVGFTQAVAEINASSTRGIYRITLSSNITTNNISFSATSAEKTIIIKGDTSLRTIFNTADTNLFTVNSGNTLVLESNVNLNGNARTGNVVQISNEGTLIMKDGSRIENTKNYGVYVYNGMFEMFGGEISGNTGGGVYVFGGVFTMSDGEISGNTGYGVSLSNATFEMSNGKINGNASTGVSVGAGTFTMSGGEINRNTGSGVSSGGTFAMGGGEISGNTASTSGGGVYVSGGNFTMSSGEISGNMASSSSYSYGGGVYVSGGSFTMSGGEISRNTASSGGGVYVSSSYNSSGTFEMSNGKISGNTASADGGGGVSVISYNSSYSSTFTMSGGEISENTASSSSYSYGGGVYVSGGRFTVSGGEISGNTASSGGGVYVSSSYNSSGTFIKDGGGIVYGSDVSSALKNTATDGIGHAVYVYVNSSTTRKRDMTAGPNVNMTSNNTDATGGWEAGEVPSGLSLEQSLTWLSNNAMEGGVYTITLANNTTIEPKTLSYSGKTVGITLSGGTTERTVSLSTTGSLFTVQSGVTLTLDNNITLQGWSDNTASLVQVSGALVMNTGSKISGNTDFYAGGVSVYSDGTFAMSGGEIIGKKGSLGSVYVSGGVFIMSGGKISGNTDAGGVGVYGGTFTMSGGEISGNGYGVYVSDGTFTKNNGGTIYGSDASSTLKNINYAVYVSSSPAKIRNTTADTGVMLDSTKDGAAGGWEE